MSYIIVTDSSCNLPNRLIEEYNLEVLSLKYFSGDTAYEGYVKGADPDFKAFYDMTRKKEPLSTTLVSPELCMEVFEKILSEGNDLLYIGFSSGLSVTYQVAHNILEDFILFLSLSMFSNYSLMAKHAPVLGTQKLISHSLSSLKVYS